MATHRQIKAAKLIATERIRATLQHHCGRLVLLHDAPDHRLEHAPVGFIGDTIAQWHVACIVFSLFEARVTQLTSTWEKLAILVKRACHHTVSRVECLFDTVAMVDVNINVENAGVVP